MDDYFVLVNVYPNAFLHTDPGIGAFAAVDPQGHVFGGISITRALGLGVGYSPVW